MRYFSHGNMVCAFYAPTTYLYYMVSFLIFVLLVSSMMKVFMYWFNVDIAIFTDD